MIVEITAYNRIFISVWRLKNNLNYFYCVEAEKYLRRGKLPSYKTF